MMGWSDEAWQKSAPPTYTCLIHEAHQVAELFGIKNVSEAVWIDQEGQIVRPSEPAGATDNFRRLDVETFTIPDDEISRLDSNRCQRRAQ
jgi:hypothetical protein